MIITYLSIKLEPTPSLPGPEDRIIVKSVRLDRV